MGIETTSESEKLSVLVVDDDEDLAELVALQLSQLGCNVCIANEVRTALLLASSGIDMIVTDYRMPGADGLDMVRAIRERRAESVPLHVVMMTSRGDDQTIRSAVEAGVDDFLYKPIEPIQMELAVASARRAVRLQRQFAKRNSALSLAHQKMRAALEELQVDLDAAAGLHERLLPKQERLRGVRVAHVYKPASVLGGDTIGASDVGGGRTLFFVIDVQGHGVKASLDSFHFHHRLKQLRPSGPEELASALASLNREVLETESETYATAVVGLVDPFQGEGWLVCAGHPAPILIEGKSASPLTTENAFPLGWFEYAEYRPTRFNFGSETRLVLYSDGLSDCSDRSGKPLGVEGLGSLMAQCGGKPIASVGSIVEFVLSLRDANPELADDVSLLAIEPDLRDRIAA